MAKDLVLSSCLIRWLFRTTRISWRIESEIQASKINFKDVLVDCRYALRFLPRLFKSAYMPLPVAFWYTFICIHVSSEVFPRYFHHKEVRDHKNIARSTFVSCFVGSQRTYFVTKFTCKLFYTKEGKMATGVLAGLLFDSSSACIHPGRSTHKYFY